MYKQKHTKRESGTDFEKSWGIHIDDLARAEDVTVDAIRMRVMKWGNPFQRRAKPSKYEKKYGKTQAQIALDLGIHPITVACREQKFGNVYYESNITTTRWNFKKTINEDQVHWTQGGSWKFTLKSTYFTLEEAQAKLAELDGK